MGQSSSKEIDKKTMRDKERDRIRVKIYTEGKGKSIRERERRRGFRGGGKKEIGRGKTCMTTTQSHLHANSESVVGL